MIKRNYYALVAGLPDIVLDDKKQIASSVQLREVLKVDLSPSDFELVKLLSLPFDHKNILNWIFKKDVEWDDRGNLSLAEVEIIADKKQMELEESLKSDTYLHHIIEVLHDEETLENLQLAQQKLTAKYYSLLLEQKNSFVRNVANYQINVNNIMSTLIGRKHQIPYENDLLGSPEMVSAFVKSKSRDFGLSREIDEIETFLQIFETDQLLERELKLDTHFWNYLEEETFFNYFTIEKVLAFLLKLFIVERWSGLDKPKGEEMFNRLLEELKGSFQFPDEFTIRYGKR